MLRDFPSFWTDLETGLAKRGRWAVENKFPTLDQVIISDKYFVRLIEGCYEGRLGESGELVEKVGHDGKTYWGTK